jgi:hypothetical protein
MGLAAAARADLIITLEAADVDGSPIVGGVPAGSVLSIDILLSVDGEDNPTADFRSLQFDFAATSSTIEVNTFAWAVDPDAYSFSVETLPTPFAASVLFGSIARLVSLDAEPHRVATIEVTVNGSGSLNAVGGTGIGQNTLARFNAGFESQVFFSLGAGNLQGGILELLVAEPPGPGSDIGDADDTSDPGEDVMGDADDAAGADDEGGDSIDEEQPGDGGTDEDADAGAEDDDEVDGGGEDGTAEAPEDVDGDDVETAPGSEGEDGDSDQANECPATAGNLCGIAMPATFLMVLCSLSGLRVRRACGRGVE